MVRYASFKYDSTSNLGDEIQTLATELHLPTVDCRIDRDSLAAFVASEYHVVVFQGWFSKDPVACFPPSEWIIPVFVGFHVEASENGSIRHILSPAGVSYLKQYEPIGCRDDGTRREMERAGIRAYTSHCLTLTFPKRACPPVDGKVFIVNASNIFHPFGDDSVHITHDMSNVFGDDVKSAAARRLLDIYRDEARLVVTTRLHCALPCLAMGIPVVFFGDPEDYRLGILNDLGVPINPIGPRWRLLHRFRVVGRLWGFFNVRRFWLRWAARQVDWDPSPIDLEEKKSILREAVATGLRNAERAARREPAEQGLR